MFVNTIKYSRHALPSFLSSFGIIVVQSSKHWKTGSYEVYFTQSPSSSTSKANSCSSDLFAPGSARSLTLAFSSFSDRTNGRGTPDVPVIISARYLFINSQSTLAIDFTKRRGKRISEWSPPRERQLQVQRLPLHSRCKSNGWQWKPTNCLSKRTIKPCYGYF